MKILLVEDEANLRRFLVKVLTRGGYEVIEASSGIEAVRLAEKHPIDVLVTDVVMEHMDGLAVAHTLLSRKPDLAVVFISGYPMNLEAVQQRIARCTFLSKPFPAQTLLDAVRHLLS